jgi:hypothetical protein
MLSTVSRSVCFSFCLLALLGCGNSQTTIGGEESLGAGPAPADAGAPSLPSPGVNNGGGGGGGPGNPGQQLCDDLATGNSATDFARAIGICGTDLVSATFPSGSGQSRAIRPRFGDRWNPRLGNKLAMLSTGKAQDANDGYSPQFGFSFFTTQPHPLWSRPRCSLALFAPPAHDVSELKLTLKVPPGAKSLSFQFNFFSAEYPEYVCTPYNDRFIALLESSALDATKLPKGGGGQCAKNVSTPTCNSSCDANEEPVTVNNGFFDVCRSAEGFDFFTNTNWKNECKQPVDLLAATGFDRVDQDDCDQPGCLVGGATGWLTSKAPVTPGETITLRFIVLDENDDIYDSSVLLDNFRWDGAAVSVPVTEPEIN